MYKHAPLDYKCPICIGLKDPGTPDTLIIADDIVYKDDLVSVVVNSFFIGNNPGHVIVVPNDHYENIYDLPDQVGHRVHEVAKKMAAVLKEAYKCDGITTMQNNEPAGDQHAFHFHFHIFPRYKDDNLHQHMTNKRLAPPEERNTYSDKLRSKLTY
ncbi:MAG: HIT family protein [Patescibacteria group bacterium]